MVLFVEVYLREILISNFELKKNNLFGNKILLQVY